MTLNISAISDAVMSELAATVQGSATRADWSDDNRHDAQCHQPRVEGRLREATKSVLTGTQELFPGEVSAEAVDDPEISGSRYLTVSCTSRRSVDDIMLAFDQWHEKLAVWAPGLEHLFRLSVDAIE